MFSFKQYMGEDFLSPFCRKRGLKWVARVLLNKELEGVGLIKLSMISVDP